MTQALTVDDYIASCPAEIQSKLNQLRQIIKSEVPQAEEKISYSMPYYGYHGRLAYFGLHKNHIGLYIPPPIIENHMNELKNYKTTVSAVQFPLNQDLPVALIKKLIQARLSHNQKSGK